MKRTATVLFLGAAVGLLSQSCGSSDGKKNVRQPTGGEGGAGEGGEATRAGSPAENPGGQGGAEPNPMGGAAGAGAHGAVAGAAGAAGANGDCPTGFDECDGDLSEACEQALNSVEACGDCQTTCSNAHGGISCENLTCKVTSCDTGYGDCNGDPNDGCETNLVSNDEHCGACARDCSSVAATCTVDSCGAIPMQQNVSIGIGNGPWNDRTWAFSSDLGIVNMTRSNSVVQWFGLDGTSSKVIWNLGTGETGNGTLIIDGQDIYWAQRGNVVRKKALSQASVESPTDVFFPDDLPAYLRRQGDYFYWISGEYGEPGYVYRRLVTAAANVPDSPPIVNVPQGPAGDITGFAVTTDAIYWITGNDLDAATLDNDIRTTPLTGGVPTSVPKVAGATDGQIKDFGNYTINANLTAVGDTLYFARTIGVSALNGVYRYKKGDAAPTKLVEFEDVSTFTVASDFIYYGNSNYQGVWRAPITGGQGVVVSPTYLTTLVGTDTKFAYIALVNQPGSFYKIFQ